MKRKPLVILVCGGSCSGKSVFAGLFKSALVLSMDHFYLGKSKMMPDEEGNYDFDSPESVDLRAIAAAIVDLREGKAVKIPIYDMEASERKGYKQIKPSKRDKLIIFEGIFAFHELIRDLGDLKIFLDTPMEIRVARRMLRDVEKGRSEIETLSWSQIVEKNYYKHIEPMKEYADLLIPFSYNPVQFSI